MKILHSLHIYFFLKYPSLHLNAPQDDLIRFVADRYEIISAHCYARHRYDVATPRLRVCPRGRLSFVRFIVIGKGDYFFLGHDLYADVLVFCCLF